MSDNTKKKKPLEIAQEKRAAMKAQGIAVERLSPAEKLARNPTSLRAAINAKCFDCMGAGCDPGWRKAIGECTVRACGLYAVRPYQGAASDADAAE